MIEIYMINGPLTGLSFELEDVITMIGRGADNDINIKDQSISRKHARIARAGDRYTIEDLESQNGTWINGHPMNPGFQVEIKEGDFIALGNVLMSVGEPYSEDGMMTHYSISLLEEGEESRKGLVYGERRITDHDKLEMMYEVSTILMQSLDVQEIAERLMDSVFSCLSTIDSGALILLDQETGKQTQIIARSRQGDEKFKMNYSRTIVNRVISQGRAIMMSDTSHADQTDLSASIIWMQIKSVMCVPLISKAEINGVIYVHSLSVAQGFSKEDLFFLTALTSPAALAIENALLFSKHMQAEQALQKAHDELEARVKERTEELSRANTQLTQEISERKQAEQNLVSMHDQLKEANKNLERAYAQMRDAKDRISSQLYSEEIVFLTDENGRISGLNDKAAEAAGETRVKLLSRSVGDLLDQESRETFMQEMKKASIGVFHHTSLRLKSNGEPPKPYHVRLMPLNMGKGKMLLLLMRKPD